MRSPSRRRSEPSLRNSLSPEAAVKQHLSRLYDKFDVGAHGERRRVQLANAAVARGAVKLGDLRADD